MYETMLIEQIIPAIRNLFLSKNYFDQIVLARWSSSAFWIKDITG